MMKSCDMQSQEPHLSATILFADEMGSLSFSASDDDIILLRLARQTMEVDPPTLATPEATASHLWERVQAGDWSGALESAEAAELLINVRT